MNRPVPTYSLYGEETAETGEFWAHAESISSRSRLYDWEIKPHRHISLFQILHIRKGSGEVLLGERTQTLLPGSAILVPERHDHGFRFSDDIDGAVITLMSKRFPGRLAAHAGLSDWLSQPRHIAIPSDHQDSAYLIETLNRAEAEIMRGQKGPAVLIEAALTTALLLMFRMSGQPAQSDASSRDQVRLAQLSDLISSEFRAHRTVAFYAKRLAMSVTHMNRIAHALTGKPVSRLIAERIVTEAKRELVFTAISIQQVAAGLGFDDQAYFSRFFVRETGMTPRDFRLAERLALAG
ncbi:MAG: helix-turn-helix domain-containing protein [Allorhizobium sp.]